MQFLLNVKLLICGIECKRRDRERAFARIEMLNNLKSRSRREIYICLKMFKLNENNFFQ